MIFYILYPFIFAIIAAGVWSYIRDVITGTDIEQSDKYAAILFSLIIVPNT